MDTSWTQHYRVSSIMLTVIALRIYLSNNDPMRYGIGRGGGRPTLPNSEHYQSQQGIHARCESRAEN